MNYKVLLAAGLLFAGAVQAQDVVRGRVYNDTNKNGVFDKMDSAVAHVSVSNGVQVVQTNSRGEYELPVTDDNIIFVVKPSGYALPVDADNHPQFYYLHKPKGSPVMLYPTSKPTGKLPKSLDFALYKQEENPNFKAFIFGDPQTYTQEELDFFNKGIVQDIKSTSGVRFGISMGDLVGDDLSLHHPYKKLIGSLGLPWFNVMGNHDMNFDAPTDTLSDETFELNFGPNNYAFNYGNAHFIVLDNILYPNPRTGKGYLGGFRKDQLDFVANDLQFVPKDKLVILAFHIPLLHQNSDVFRNEDRQRLFDILADYPNVMAISAHTHFQQQIFYDAKDGWKQAKPLHEYNVGTTSGDWYSGQVNADGVPVSTMRDGTPKGYALLRVDNNRYAFDYKVAGAPESYQIKLVGPAVVKASTVRRYKVYANFFMGKAGDKVSYRINSGNWQEMEYVSLADPQYMYELLKYDNAAQLIPGKRPSDPELSTHLWQLNLPKLKSGIHTIEVQAVDMYGKQHQQSMTIEVL
ncbi:calcineurin-like phosphoesterase C-terminal domain-containing protein [Sphingobacterium sp. Mn56C]|uniref:calcineurin-like phosphoesterase C-terminal domain-containing protein n=1 Tax=Sphingobacterium sp. Mn56C TaxID=3395261 RepID=UPI003BC31002